MAEPTDLAAFLRARRAALPPAAVGLQAGERRRVAGLRREELAALAGVSVDYYVRLEQGRGAHPSASVLDAIARALELDETETAYLHGLVARPARRRRRPPAERARPEVEAVVRAITNPAFVLGRRMDVLAWNHAAAALIGDFGAMPVHERNMVRHAFDPATRDFYVDWEQIAQESVGYLRLAAADDPDDPRLAELVGELSLRSPQFARWWASHKVREKGRGIKRIRHPLVGEVEVTYETFRVEADPDQRLVIYTAAPGSPSATALELLHSA